MGFELRACPGRVSSSAGLLRLANDSQAAAASPTSLISSMNIAASRVSWSDSGGEPLKQVSACPRMSRRLGLPGLGPLGSQPHRGNGSAERVDGWPLSWTATTD